MSFGMENESYGVDFTCLLETEGGLEGTDFNELVHFEILLFLFRYNIIINNAYTSISTRNENFSMNSI